MKRYTLGVIDMPGQSFHIVRMRSNSAREIARYGTRILHTENVAGLTVRDENRARNLTLNDARKLAGMRDYKARRASK